MGEIKGLYQISERRIFVRWSGLLTIMSSLMILGAFVFAGCDRKGDPDAPGYNGPEREVLEEYIGKMSPGNGPGGLVFYKEPARAAGPPPTLTHITSWKQTAFQKPVNLAEDADGNILVVDAGAAAIYTLSPEGMLLSTTRIANDPMSVEVTATNNLIIGDKFNHRVLRINSVGTVSGEFCSDAGWIDQPADIAVEQLTGNVWIADNGYNKIIKCDQDGNLLFSFGTTGTANGQFDWPQGLALYETPTSGEVYISDRHNGRIQVHDLDGAYLRTISEKGGGDGYLSQGRGLDLDSSNRVYVAEAYQGQLEAFDSDGGFLAWLGEMGFNAGTLHRPADVLIDSYNRLIVASSANGRIEVYGLDSYTNPTVDTLVGLAKPNNIQLSVSSSSPYMGLYLDLPDVDDAIDPATLKINGVDIINEQLKPTTNVTYNGMVYELSVAMNAASLKSMYAVKGFYDVPISGSTTTGIMFTGTFQLKVTY